MKLDFRDQIRKNKTRSIILLIIIFIAFIILGYVISLAFGPEYFSLIMIIAIIVSILYVLGTYSNAEVIAIKSANAKPADPVEHRNLFIAIENMSIASGLPIPKAYIMPGEQINAFATGRSPKKSMICVTEGCIKKLNKQELEGVIAHEMSHIANYDIRYMTIVGVVVGAIAIFSQIFLRSLWFSGGTRGGGGRDSGNGQIIFFIIAIALAILAPIIVTLIQLSISRKREYMADATAVRLTRYPPGLIGALKKIKEDYEKPKQKPLKLNKSLTPMLFSAHKKMNAASALSTHPPIAKRIEALEKM